MTKPEVNINDEREVRIKKMKDLQEAGINPYPAKSEDKLPIAEAFVKAIGEQVNTAGRIMTKREMGKLMFCHLRDESGEIQIVLKQDELEKESYKRFEKKVDIGDIVEIAGERFQTQKGEESVLVKDYGLLTKALRPLPDKFHGLADEETRLRKRYLDLLTNPELKEVFRRKAMFWHSMRTFLLEEGFMEVETPVLEATAGGADATPFSTHHNALDMDVYLRISMGELWQKRLMVAGFEKTFEIGRQFRNEGMSREHLQDYTQMEFYWGYADYEKSMELVERMYKYIIEKTWGTLTFDIGKFKGIDLGQVWERIDYAEEIQKHTGVDITKATEDEIKKKLDELSVAYESFEGRGRQIDLLWKQCRKHIAGPVFLVHHPVDVSPLAKRHETLHNATERYQIIIAGSELGNGYSELNDPIDQAGRFAEQARLREAGDSEAQMHDADFVEALEHGMPPTSGFGVSERLFSFLEDKPIRECVLFPLMRPEQENTNTQPIKTSNNSESETFDPLPVDRDGAMKLLDKHHEPGADYTHYLESEVVMRGLAKRLGRDEEYWGLLGLLHDLDWGYTKQDEAKHCTMTPKILREEGFPEDFIENVLSHAYGSNCGGLNDKVRTREIEYAIACGETVTGLVHAAARIRPEKIASLKVSSLKKKFKNKKFAKKVDRNVIMECEKLGLPLEEFLQISIDSITEIADQVDLV